MDVIMPQLGETVAEGTVAAWHKKEGDQVTVDELLVEIENYLAEQYVFLHDEDADCCEHGNKYAVMMMMMMMMMTIL